MRRSILICLLAGGFGAALAAAAFAQVSVDQVNQLDGGSKEITNEGSTDGGAAAVTQAIAAAFGVTEGQVTALRSDGLGYGEIAILFAVAQTMTGGLTSDNIAVVLGMRQGPPVVGWGKIAQDMGLNLGTLVSRVKNVAGRSPGLQAASASDNGNGNGRSDGASAGERGGAAGMGIGHRP